MLGDDNDMPQRFVNKMLDEKGLLKNAVVILNNLFEIKQGDIMVKLRLRRMGANDQPFYRIVAVDSRVKRDGKYIECVGWYDPKPNPSKINIETERAIYWLGVGAQPTDTVRSLLRKAGVLQIWHERKIAQRAETESDTQ